MKSLNSKKKSIFVLPLIMIFAVAIYIASNLGSWLMISDPLPPSLDVLFTLSGEMSRIVYSKQLIAKYPGVKWFFSYPRKKVMSNFAREGFDTSRIFIVDTCSNTRSEIAFLKNLVKSQPASLMQTETAISDDVLKIGIISNWYHMRRIKLIMDTQIKNKTCKFYYLPAPPESEDTYKKWWRNKSVRNVVRLEWEKIFLYRFTHF